MNNHIWELDIVEDYYLGLDTTEKRSVADYLLTRNAAIMLIVEENKIVTKMFDAMVLDTIYEGKERQEHGVTKQTLIPIKLMIRRQISFFGGTTAGKVAEEQEGETPVPTKIVEKMDGAVQLPDSEDEDDYYRDDDFRQQFDEANGEKPVFNLRSMIQQQESIKRNSTDQIKLMTLCVWNSISQMAHQRQMRKENNTIQLSYL